jgi:hypothetical protein
MTSKIDGSANICHLQDLPVVAREFGGIEINGPDAREVHVSGQGEDHVWFEDRWMAASLCDE